MKIIIVALVCVMTLLIAVKSEGQVFVSAGAGISAKPTNFVAELNIGGIIKNSVVVNAGFLAAPTQSTEVANVYYAKLGKIVNLSEVFYIAGYAGYGYQEYGNNKSELNKSRPLFSIEAVKKLSFNNFGQLYMSVVNSGKITAATIGIRGLLGKKYNNRDGFGN